MRSALHFSPFARLLFVLTLGVLSATSARAQQIYFAMEATASETKGGYTEGASYTFVIGIGSFASTNTSEFDSPGTHALWQDGDMFDPQLFTSLSGSAFLGTYTRPANAASSIQMAVSGGDGVLTLVSGDTTKELGSLTTLAGVGRVFQFKADIKGFAFTAADSGAYPDSYIDPVIYFGDRDGTTASVFESEISVTFTDEGGNYDINYFTVTSAMISTMSNPFVAVPEPSTCAALAGATALCFAGWRRGRKAVKAAGLNRQG